MQAILRWRMEFAVCVVACMCLAARPSHIRSDLLSIGRPSAVVPPRASRQPGNAAYPLPPPPAPLKKKHCARIWCFGRTARGPWEYSTAGGEGALRPVLPCFMFRPKALSLSCRVYASSPRSNITSGGKSILTIIQIRCFAQLRCCSPS
jgi:hypothetical protein